MVFDERDRIRFHKWLVAHELEPEVADAILGTMQPFDWHEVATKSDLALLEERIDRRFDHVDRQFDLTDRRFDTVDTRFDAIDNRFDAIDSRFESIDRQFAVMDDRLSGVAQEIRAVLFTLIGVIVSVLLAGGAALWG